MNLKIITATTTAALSGTYKINVARLVAGSGAAATAVLYDSTAGVTAGEFLTLQTGQGDVDIEYLPGESPTSAGLSVSLAGSGAKLYIYYA